MSAITGLHYLDGRPINRPDLERMGETLAHRGPDSVGVWNQGAVGLGSRILRTTPESLHERLPLVSETGDLAITADARIDNRDELIAALGINGRPREEISDSELILGAYERWGEGCPERLVGDFAFAIWDGRKQLLFAARDQMGIRPFYYYHRSDRAFAFASEIKALLAVPEVPRRLNETRVADFLGLQFEDKAITLYQEILRLPPAHCMTVDRGGARLRPYWALDPSRELRLGSDEEYAEAFREVFTEAVRCRLRSAFPLGSLLSGGLDSSSITCVARDLMAQNGSGQLHTFSAVFDEFPECDERPFINAVVALNGIEPHYLNADRVSPMTDIDRVLWHQDEPFYAGNLCLSWALYGAVRNQGVPILLDGLLGDAAVSHGLEYLPYLARKGRWITFFREAYGLSRRRRAGSWSYLWSYLWNMGFKPAAPGPVRQAWRLLRHRRRQPSTDDAANGTIINPDFARRIHLAERVQALDRDRPNTVRTPREEHWHALTSGLFPLALEIADRAAAAFSIEPRYPYLDSRLLEFCLALPPEQKLHGGWIRVIVRRALADSLPETVRWRGGKAAFGSAFTAGLLTLDRELLDEVILDDPSVIEGYVSTAALRQAYDRCLSGGEGTDSLTIWTAAILALWLRRTGLAP